MFKGERLPAMRIAEIAGVPAANVDSDAAVY
jgi:hypothetical protein